MYENNEEDEDEDTFIVDIINIINVFFLPFYENMDKLFFFLYIGLKIFQAVSKLQTKML